MSITVKVAVVPGRMQELALEPNATVKQALEAAGIDASGKVIKVGGRDATTSTPLYSGATVLVSGKITGNTDEDNRIFKEMFSDEICQALQNDKQGQHGSQQA